MTSDCWKINILTLKRNVFFSISDSNNKVKKLLTPGLLLRGGIRRAEYNKLDDKRDRRKKRSLRLFLNNQKLTRPACAQTWNLMYSYILENKLRFQKFILILGGSNLKTSLALGQSIIKNRKLNVAQVIIKATPPHNGCPQKIKKRKKNKGRNKRLKKSLTKLYTKQPSIPRDFKAHNNILFPMFHYEQGLDLVRKNFSRKLFPLQRVFKKKKFKAHDSDII
jgi:hypothetical protein